jgi:hypothetical protein
MASINDSKDLSSAMIGGAINDTIKTQNMSGGRTHSRNRPARNHRVPLGFLVRLFPKLMNLLSI